MTPRQPGTMGLVAAGSTTQFRGSVVTSFLSYGWPLGRLIIEADTMRFRSVLGESVVPRSHAEVIEFHKLRSAMPLLIRTYIVARLVDGTAHRRMFIAWRPRAVRRHLERTGWRTADAKVTARQILFSPRP